MNISELIVDLLEKGQKVEIPGIGTLESVILDAHHDPETQTYYPASRTIAYRSETTGDESIVASIAEIDCVKMEVAKQMWHNYVDALTDKVKSSGEHSLGRLGKLTCEGKKQFGFTMAEGVVLDAGNKDDVPITGVKTYAHENEADPFAQFDDEVPIRKVEPDEQPTPPATEVETDDVEIEKVEAEAAQPEPEDSEAQARFQSELDRLDEAKPSEELQRIEEKLLAREERNRAKHKEKMEREQRERERKAEEERKRADAQLAKEREELKRKAEEEKRREEEALRRAEKHAAEEKERAAKLAEENRIKAEKKAAALAALSEQESSKAEKAAAAKAEKEAERQRIANERKQQQQQKEAAAALKAQQKEAKKRQKKQQKEATAALKAQQKAAEKQQKQQQKEAKKAAAATVAEAQSNNTTTHTDPSGRGKKKTVVVLLVVILLLVAGGAAYMLLGRNLQGGTMGTTAQSSHLKDVPPSNSLTFNCDMVDYTHREMIEQREKVCRFMNNYISRFLGDRRYGYAKGAMMDRVRLYVDQRMGELLGERFAMQRMLPYDDYIYNYNLPYLKKHYANEVRHLVQGELMDYHTLDAILDKMVDELDLVPGGARGTGAYDGDAESPSAKAKKRSAATTSGTPAYVYVLNKSKQGYDVIAGFYRVKDSAAKMTSNLRAQGCDAYLIELDGGYYVSMGSAATQTAAEALLKHIESWYDGAVVVKKL